MLLRKLARGFSQGFSEADADRMSADVQGMGPGEYASFRYPDVVHRGTRSPELILHVRRRSRLPAVVHLWVMRSLDERDRAVFDAVKEEISALDPKRARER